MTRREIQEILPLFVAGTLSSDQKAEVELAVTNDPDLQEELQFWKGVHVATRADQAWVDKGHPSSEQVVDYVHGMIPPGEERLLLESHFQSCPTCRNEVSLLREMLERSSLAEPAAKQRFSFSSILNVLARPIVVFPVLVLAFAAGLYFSVLNPDNPPTNELNGAASLGTSPPNEPKRAALLLPLEMKMRDPKSSRTNMKTLRLTDDIGMVDISVALQFSAIPAVYNVSIHLPSGKEIVIADSARPVRRDGAVNLLHIAVMEHNFPDEGRYRIRVREVFLVSVPDLEPEDLRYEFMVARAKAE